MERLLQWLEESDCGILCLTPENLTAPWMFFEAGVISKKVDRSRVIPFLFQVSPERVKLPLSAFQVAQADRAGFQALFRSINDAVGTQIPPDSLGKLFDTWWPSLEEALKNIPSKITPSLVSELIPLSEKEPSKRHFISDDRLDQCKEGDFVRFIAITGRNLFDREPRPGERLLFVEALKRGVKFQGVVLDPTSPQADERASIESPGKPKGRRLLDVDTDKMNEWLKGKYLDAGVPLEKIRNLEIRYSKSLLSFGMILYQDVAFVEPFHFGKIDNLEHLCGFSIIMCPRGSHDYQVVEKHFDYLFRSGSAIK